MKLQLALLGITAAVSLAIGGVKWKARWLAASDFAGEERAGNWRIVVSGDEGLALWSESEGRRAVKPWDRFPVIDGYAVTPDLKRIAVVDNSDYVNGPKLVVRAASRPRPPIATARSTVGGQIQCPTFDHDGAILYIRTEAWSSSPGASARPQTRLMRMPLPASDVEDGTAAARVAEVLLPFAPSTDDCPERSGDGTVLAWVGTDFKIHTARRDPSGSFSDHFEIPGNDFALAPGGTHIAVNDGGRLVEVSIPGGSRRTIAPDARVSRIAGYSPDGRWVATQSWSSGYGGGLTAWRLSDGAPVPLGLRISQQYGWDMRARSWIAWTGEELPDPPSPPPTATARPGTRRRAEP